MNTCTTLQALESFQELVDTSTVVLISLNLFFLLVLWQWHKSNSIFDFRRALLDPSTNALSFHRLGQLVALVMTTEWGTYEVVHGRLSEWFVMAYLAAWGGLAAYSKWQDSSNAKNNVIVPSHPDPRVKQEGE